MSPGVTRRPLDSLGAYRRLDGDGRNLAEWRNESFRGPSSMVPHIRKTRQIYARPLNSVKGRVTQRLEREHPSSRSLIGSMTRKGCLRGDPLSPRPGCVCFGCVHFANRGHQAELPAANDPGSNIGAVRVIAEILNKFFFATVRINKARLNSYPRHDHPPGSTALLSIRGRGFAQSHFQGGSPTYQYLGTRTLLKHTRNSGAWTMDWAFERRSNPEPQSHLR